MKNREADALLMELAGCDSITHQQFDMTKFSYALAKNYNKLANNLKEYHEEKKKIIDESNKIKEKHAIKDKKGNIIFDEQQQFKFDVEKYNDEIEKLKLNEKIIKLSEIEAEPIEFYKIAKNDVPPNLTPKQMRAVIDMIDEN